jgi:hypothetical protein
MANDPKVDDQTKRIMERLLKTPPDPKTKKPNKGGKPSKRTSGKGRARVGKGKN